MHRFWFLTGAGLAALSATGAAWGQEPRSATPRAPVQAPVPVPSITLRDALVLAYRGNPALTGQRATQRAIDENVPLARANGLPSVTVSPTYTENLHVSGQAGFARPARQLAAQGGITLPVYAGGAVRNGVRAAEQRVLSGRAGLRSVEANVFTNVVAAYNDVLRDEAIVGLNQQNVRVLEVNLRATRDRFEVGDLTRTDVAQSEARLAQARAQLQASEATLVGSRERFINQVGAPAGPLQDPPPLPNLPADPNGAVRVAVQNNPALEAARRESDAAGFDVRVARSAKLPRVSATLGGSYQTYLGSLGNNSGIAQDGSAATASVSMNLPLFQGGRPGAQVRQAQALESAAIEQVTETERAVITDVRSAFAAWQSSLRVIESSEVAVSANQLSLEGVRAENSVGTRTVLDILDAEQELLNAQVQLVSARRDAYVAGFALLAAMGRAEARDLNLDGGALYDPVANYDRVRNRINDWDDDPAPVPVAPSTLNTPAQTPALAKPLEPGLQRRANPYEPTQGLDAPDRRRGDPLTPVDSTPATPDR